jgi:hypothetical protein
MQNKKKNEELNINTERSLFLLLAAIPAYGAYGYTRYVFESVPFSWNDLVCFSVFVICAVFLSAKVKKPIHAAVPAVVHAVLFVFVFLPYGNAFFKKPQILYYLICCIPGLMILGMLPESSAKAPTKKKEEKNGNKPFCFPARRFSGLHSGGYGRGLSDRRYVFRISF